MKQNNVEYQNYFTFNSYNENFSKTINQKNHTFEFMIVDMLVENNNFYKMFITSIMVILNCLKKDGNCIFRINIDIFREFNLRIRCVI